MKKISAMLVMVVGMQISASAQTIIKPSINSKTSFAIVVDQASYEHAETEIMEYRASVEADGLGTYLLVDAWKNPAQIREHLLQLHRAKKAPLEGCVFVGDIPVPMIRDAHHLCSAFKMAPSNPWQRSSVPSDRYYDDFDLTLDYLKQDEEKPLLHYFSLSPDSKQYLSPDIYSARIKPTVWGDKDKYQLLKDYLKKVVKEKRENANNVIDKLSMARGHGYNSEDLLAWSGEQLALREQLPQVFNQGNTVKFFDFSMGFPMKNYYLNEVLNEDLDVMLFHHHGGTTAQYINGFPNPKSVPEYIEEIKRYLRSKVPAIADKKGKEAAIEQFVKQYNIPSDWCEEAFDPEMLKQDSLFNLTLDILAEEIHQLKPSARFVMFDACYTGSFQLDDCLAGSYLFTDGKTIAVQACSVNSIQDKWPNELLGLLNAGMRIGHFNRLNCFLENHILGDPTYRFANSTSLKGNINEMLTLKVGDITFWKKQLKSQLPDMQSLALRQLADADYAEMPELLQEMFFQSPYFVVRLQAMRLLTLNYCTQAVPVLEAALNDSYELIRRYAGEFVEKNGSPELIPAWVNAFMQRNHEKRLRSKIMSGLDAFDYDQLAKAIESQASKYSWYTRAHIDDLLKQVERESKSTKNDLAIINNRSSKLREVRIELRSFRNHPCFIGVDPMIAVINDEQVSEELRIIAAEALGWYNLHHNKAYIVELLKQVNTSNKAVMTEVKRTINRLVGKNR